MLRKQHTGLEFLVALTTTAVVAAVCYPISGSIGYQSVGLIFLMAISILSLFLGRAALIFAALLNFGVWNFFFIQPLYTFRVHSLHDLIALFTNLIVALAATALISRIKNSQVTLQKSREQMELIHRFLESLNDAISIKDVVKRVEEGIQANFTASIVVYLKEKTGQGLACRPFGNSTLHTDPLFQGARNAFADQSVHKQDAAIRESPAHDGNMSDYIQNQQKPESIFHEPSVMDDAIDGPVYLYPLIGARKSIGVIGIRFPERQPPVDEKLILLQSFITLIASALEREINIDQLKEKEISAESEKLFQTVLNSVSHELRTPISIISAAAANLNDVKTSSEPALRKQIAEELEIASVRLNHLVENILGMSRIESGLLRMNLEICDIQDLMGIVHHDLKNLEHELRIDVDENIPFIRADINLLKQAVINVLHNAVSYTPANSVILMEVRRGLPGEITIAIMDEGPGIPEQFLTHLFEKFYRVPGTRSGGTGLGLTITKAIVELHGGGISVRNRPGKGLEVTIMLKIGN